MAGILFINFEIELDLILGFNFFVLIFILIFVIQVYRMFLDICKSIFMPSS